MVQDAQENLMEKTNWHWRNTMRPVRFFNLDARAAMPFFVLLLYARWITLFITITVTLVFWYVERKGLTFPAALRTIRVWMIGYHRPAWFTMRHRRMRDYG